MNAPTPILMDIDQRAALPFPQSLPEFQRLFPDDAACAEYLEKARWGDGFVCPHCVVTGEPFRIATRPGVLACRKCRRQTGLTVGTVMERSHTPLSTWSPARPPACRPSSSNGNSGSRVTRQPFRSFTNCAREWSARTRIASVAARTSMSRWTKPGSAVGHAAKAEAFTTRLWSPAPLRCAIGSLEPRRTCERMGAMRGAFGWQLLLTVAPNRFVGLSMAPSLRGRWSSRTIGAVTPACGNAATITTPLPNVAIPK